jgi:hypothetical protein
MHSLSQLINHCVSVDSRLPSENESDTSTDTRASVVHESSVLHLDGRNSTFWSSVYRAVLYLDSNLGTSVLLHFWLLIYCLHHSHPHLC